jgi:mono/diheme cytochrome c family protein
MDDARNTVAIIMKGLASPAGPTMPAYADLLDDRQVQELAAYLRTRFTDKPPWPDLQAAVVQSRQEEARQGEQK